MLIKLGCLLFPESHSLERHRKIVIISKLKRISQMTVFKQEISINNNKVPGRRAIGQRTAEPEDKAVLYTASGNDTKAKQIDRPTRITYV